MKKGNLLVIGVIAILYIVFKLCAFVVNEKQQVVLTQFGKPVGEAITEPGLYFKTPFVQTANFFEKRFLEWDGNPKEVPTKEKRNIYVDVYARWTITNPLQFFKRLKTEQQAQSRLDDIIDGETRNFIASNYFEEAVRSSNRESIVNDSSLNEDHQRSQVRITVGRDKIQAGILEAVNLHTAELGIRILDVRFKKLNYIAEDREKVYDRMISERKKKSDRLRSEGQGEASRINGEKERELKVLQSEAFKTSEQIKGKADAKAASIYTSAYNQSAKSRELYGFLKSMETFEKTFDKETSVILSTDSDLYRYLKTMK